MDGSKKPFFLGKDNSVLRKLIEKREAQPKSQEFMEHQQQAADFKATVKRMKKTPLWETLNQKRKQKFELQTDADVKKFGWNRVCWSKDSKLFFYTKNKNYHLLMLSDGTFSIFKDAKGWPLFKGETPTDGPHSIEKLETVLSTFQATQKEALSIPAQNGWRKIFTDPESEVFINDKKPSASLIVKRDSFSILLNSILIKTGKIENLTDVLKNYEL